MKDVLFFSHYCVYSKQLMTDLAKMSLKDDFVMVCVEKHKDAIPPAIDRVPTILTREGHVLCDDGIAEYLEAYSRYQSRQQRQDKRDNDEDSERRATSEDQGSDDEGVHDLFSYTDAGFSYIADDTQGNTGHYGIFGQDQHIHTPEEDAKKADDASSNYERYKAGRDADIGTKIGVPSAKLARIPNGTTR